MTDDEKSLESKSLIERLDVEFALKAAGLGVWEMDPDTKLVSWDERCRELFGLAKDNVLPYEKAITYIHPDDLKIVNDAVNKAINPQSNGNYDVTYRTLGADDGLLRWVRFVGQRYLNDKGEVFRFAGIAQDVTEDVKVQNQLRSLAENAPDIISRWDKNGKLIYQNISFEGQAGDYKFLKTDSLQEIFYPTKNQLRTVLETGKPTKQINAIPTPEGEVFFHFRLVPELDTNGEVESVLAIALDITALKESEKRYQTMIEQSPMAIGLLTSRNMVLELGNNKLFEVWGKSRSVVGKRLVDISPELEKWGFIKLLEEVYDTGTPYFGIGIRTRFIHEGELRNVYFDFICTPMYNTIRAVTGIMVMAVNVTDQIISRKAIEKSEARFRSLIQEAPVATCLFMGKEMIIEIANEMMVSLWGKDRSVIGKSVNTAIPELSGQPFLHILNEVFTTGKAYKSIGARAQYEVDGRLNTYYIDYTFKPLFNERGQVFAIINMAFDVTESIMAKKELQESERFSTMVFNNSPVAKLVVVGPEMIIRSVNENMLEMLGRDKQFIMGKSLMEAIPEFKHTPMAGRLERVLSTGETYYNPEEKFQLNKISGPYTGYYTSIYKVLSDGAGENYGVIITATEVSEQVLARQKIEEAEETLRGAVELAELATWSINVETGEVTYGPRMKEWIGIQENDSWQDVEFNYIQEDSRERIRMALQEAMLADGVGEYDQEYPIVNVITGRRRIIHAQAKTYFDENHKPYKLVGTAQDITEQKDIQLALEQKVQFRTEELAVINEELASINEEYSATNDELSEANEALIRSNENLQKFAYVASHDLQEPLRKIQAFGDILKNRYAAELGDGISHLERMQSAAKRMSNLIEDLLVFSKISMQGNVTSPVSLTWVLKTVMNDLELTIQEAGASLIVDALPMVKGEELQLGQLFQNLISNALKFRQADKAPVIHITWQIISDSNLPASVKPLRTVSAYDRIDITDNGIGFDEIYADRIFQVFQRLHGKNEYPGTGVGLAICEKVVANLGGAISVKSQPNMGSTFSIFLPIG